MEIVLCSHRENVVVKNYQEHMWLIVPFGCKVGFISKFCNSLEMARLRISNESSLVISSAQHKLSTDFSFW